MKEIGIDIETKSDQDLSSTGVYRYVESKHFSILLFAYSVDGAAPKIIDLTKESMPSWLLKALVDPRITKTAWNANFERVCINKHFGLNMPIESWDCTMVRTSLLGYPLSLDLAGKIMQTEVKKDKAGKALIKMFCEKMVDPESSPEAWENFKQYCLGDVKVEQAIRQRVIKFQIPAFERSVWILDQKLNDRGIKLDRDLVRKAVEADRQNTINLIRRAKELIKVDNPNSDAQIKKWIYSKTGVHVKSLAKGNDFVSDDPEVKEMLMIRSELKKSSNAKYVAMMKCICKDDRIRGILQYNGANRTARWAGRLVQVHNLVRNSMHDLDTARIALKSESIDMLYDNIGFVLSQLIRTSFIADKGKTFIVSDFSSIEARVLAWLAGEKWKIDIFNSHGKIYEATAARMFNVPIEQITKGSELRTKGKISELALGYQGSVGALERMGGGAMGLTEMQMLGLVRRWRRTNPNIVRFWNNIQDAVVDVLRFKAARKVGRIGISYQDGILFLELPSTRKLGYVGAKISAGKITYGGLDQMTKQWYNNQTTYGGKLTENIVQAIARDCLADKLLELDKAGYEIAMHVHDEVVIEADEKNSKAELENINAIMKKPISWAKDLPLGVESFINSYYKKD